MKQTALIVMKIQFILNKIKTTFEQTELTQEHICYVLLIFLSESCLLKILWHKF